MILFAFVVKVWAFKEWGRQWSGRKEMALEPKWTKNHVDVRDYCPVRLHKVR